MRMHLPYESRGRRRREMAELEPWWMQSIIEETRAEHPDLGKGNHLLVTKLYHNEKKNFFLTFLTPFLNELITSGNF